MLQAVLPIEDADANAAFTKVVDAALEAHKSKYVKFTEADEKYSVALFVESPSYGSAACVRLIGGKGGTWCKGGRGG